MQPQLPEVLGLGMSRGWWAAARPVSRRADEAVQRRVASWPAARRVRWTEVVPGSRVAVPRAGQQVNGARQVLMLP
jgi:hypothetical protein